MQYYRQIQQYCTDKPITPNRYTKPHTHQRYHRQVRSTTQTNRYTKPHTYVLPQTDRYPLSHGDMHHPMHYHNIRVYAFKDVQTGEEDRGEGKGWLEG